MSSVANYTAIVGLGPDPTSISLVVFLADNPKPGKREPSNPKPRAQRSLSLRGPSPPISVLIHFISCCSSTS